MRPCAPGCMKRVIGARSCYLDRAMTTRNHFTPSLSCARASVGVVALDGPGYLAEVTGLLEFSMRREQARKDGCAAPAVAWLDEHPNPRARLCTPSSGISRNNPAAKPVLGTGSIQGQYAHSGGTHSPYQDPAGTRQRAQPTRAPWRAAAEASSRSHHNTLNAEARTPPLGKFFAL
jgi:hypothetical protein